MGLKEPIEPQQPVSLRFILISPAAHQHDMVAHEVPSTLPKGTGRRNAAKASSGLGKPAPARSACFV
jgi:hypothetical protein